MSSRSSSLPGPSGSLWQWLRWLFAASFVLIINMSATQKLFTTYHQIMTFMSLCDIIASVSMALATIPTPKSKLYKFDGFMMVVRFSTVAVLSYRLSFYSWQLDPFCIVSPYSFGGNELVGTRYEGLVECGADFPPGPFWKLLRISAIDVSAIIFGIALAMVIMICTALQNERQIIKEVEKRDHTEDNELDSNT